MRVKIVGDSESARVLRAYLHKAGIAVSERLPKFALSCTIHLSEHPGQNIICDSIDCPLEMHILRHVTELTEKDVILRRRTGVVSTENEIHLSIPTGDPESGHAVETGILRGVQRAHFHRPWWRRVLPALLLVSLLAPTISAAPRHHAPELTAETSGGTIHISLPPGGLFPQFQTGGGSSPCSGTTAPAHSFCGNNTGSVAAPAYVSLTAADLPLSITSNTSGLAATATAFAATPSLCTAGQAATGINTVGNAQGCFTPGGLANPMTTLGDIIYGASSGTPTRLGANSTGTNQFLRSISSGVPLWAQPTITDIGAGSTSAAYTFTTNQTFSSINQTCYADQQVGADMGAKINACVSALGSFGGIIDGTGFQGAQTISTQVVLSKAGVLKLSGVQITCAQALGSSPCMKATASTFFDFGVEYNDPFTAPNGGTQFLPGGTFSGYFIQILDPVATPGVTPAAMSWVNGGMYECAAVNNGIQIQNQLMVRISNVRIHSCLTGISLVNVSASSYTEQSYLDNVNLDDPRTVGISMVVNGGTASFANAHWGAVFIRLVTCGATGISTDQTANFRESSISHLKIWMSSGANSCTMTGIQVGNGSGVIGMEQTLFDKVDYELNMTGTSPVPRCIFVNPTTLVGPIINAYSESGNITCTNTFGTPPAVNAALNDYWNGQPFVIKDKTPTYGFVDAADSNTPYKITVNAGSRNLEFNENSASKNQHFPRTCFLIADSSGSSSATLANITWANSCTFPVAASTVYSYECDIQSTSTNVAGGLLMGITGPVTPTASNYALSQAMSVSTTQYHNISQTTSYSTAGAGVIGQTITTNWPAHFAGTFENGTTAGTLSIQFANGSATGSTVLKRGSFCTVQ